MPCLRRGSPEVSTLSTESESQAGFEIESKLTDYEPRRAYDLILPPLDEDTLKRIRMGDYEPEWLISDIENGTRTGCVKVDNNDTKSRGAILVCRGSAVGCMAFSEAQPQTEPTE